MLLLKRTNSLWHYLLTNQPNVNKGHVTRYGSVCIHVADGENSVITCVSFAKIKDCIGEWAVMGSILKYMYLK